MLNGQDIKTGVLERIANAINKPLYFSFSEKVELMTDDEMRQHDTEVAEGGWNVHTNKPAATPVENPIEGIPLIPINAMAGFGTGVFQIMVYDCEHYVVPMFKGADFLIPVGGDSMEPK